MCEFKIGDHNGKSGNIVHIKKGGRFTQGQCTVEFDQQISGGHPLSGPR